MDFPCVASNLNNCHICSALALMRKLSHVAGKIGIIHIERPASVERCSVENEGFVTVIFGASMVK
ncbi:hypothetical protein RRF57_012545 [Xylaria bambusicola]|uniref:Uncharacterized protein n=1 Tax=Xylaria bambusicola TaxID=326684 RepID=A0AAN7UY62_9PEZI